MGNQQVRGDDPVLPRHKPYQVLFNFFRGLFLGEVQPMRQPRHMRINHHTGLYTESVSQDDVSCFARHARQLQQLVHGVWHLTAVLFGQNFRGALNRGCLIAKETSGANVFLQLLRGNLR